MSNELITSVVTILTALIGVAIIATLVSKNANTVQVIGAGSSAFNSGLGTALSPVTGSGSLGSFTGGGGSLSASNL
jgi:PRD1 phage membrane DNA delivery